MMTGPIFAALGISFLAAVLVSVVQERIKVKRARLEKEEKSTFPPEFWRKLGVI